MRDRWCESGFGALSRDIQRKARRVHFRFTFAAPCCPQRQEEAPRMSKYATKLQWGNGRWIVMLSREDKLIAAMSLEDWTALTATKHALEYKPPVKQTRPVPKWLTAGRSTT
jgi:hypothetical protein